MDKNLDCKGRWRSVIVSFRVSSEESEELNRRVKLSGLNKQDYIIRRLSEKDIIVQGNPRVHKALREEMNTIIMLMREIDPYYLYTVPMTQLFDNIYGSKQPIIDNFLFAGTYLFAGAPKIGKSFFMAQLAYHVSMGIPMWEYPVHQGTVLYLALEDTYARLQSRLSRMFGTDNNDNLHFATKANNLSDDLDKQLESFISEHMIRNLKSQLLARKR